MVNEHFSFYSYENFITNYFKSFQNHSQKTYFEDTLFIWILFVAQYIPPKIHVSNLKFCERLCQVFNLALLYFTNFILGIQKKKIVSEISNMFSLDFELFFRYFSPTNQSISICMLFISDNLNIVIRQITNTLNCKVRHLFRFGFFKGPQYHKIYFIKNHLKFKI